MSRPKPDLASGWLRAEELLDREADRLATMSDDEFEREMRGEPRPAQVPTVEQLQARHGGRGEARGPGGGSPEVERVAARRKRRPWAVWLAVAAVLLVLLAVGAVVRRPLVAWMPGARLLIGSDPGDGSRGPAAALRAKALAACDDGNWSPCGSGLDAARAIDPDGERTPRVEAARRALAAHTPTLAPPARKPH